MDHELVRRAMRGDSQAFDGLGRARIDRLFAIAFRILRSHADAEDAVQQALWTAWRDLPGLREPERFDAWLYRLTVHACTRVARRERPHRVHLAIVPDLDRDDGRAGPDAVGDRDELERAFAALTPEQRATVVLHHYVGLPLTEVAEVLGIPPGTARSRLHYAHDRLRARLRADSQRAAGGTR